MRTITVTVQVDVPDGVAENYENGLSPYVDTVQAKLVMKVLNGEYHLESVEPRSC